MKLKEIKLIIEALEQDKVIQGSSDNQRWVDIGMTIDTDIKWFIGRSKFLRVKPTPKEIWTCPLCNKFWLKEDDANNHMVVHMGHIKIEHYIQQL